jgi:metal-responsive CopG/Arc/MetJ family transcriptional regulator
MHHRMTITLEESVYQNLKRMVAPRHRSQFIEDAIRPLVSDAELEADYAALAADEKQNAEASEWMNGLIKDMPDETW